MRRRLLLITGLLAVLALPSAAEGKVVWRIKGGGFGHGVGMSQYGAYGFAKKGAGYAAILGHYYRGTTLGPAPSSSVRVLLRPNASSLSVSGASAACGASLNEAATYTATRSGNSVSLRAPNGTAVGNCGTVASVTGGDAVTLNGKGTYRGAIDLRVASGPGLNAINNVDLENYVRGVVARESPSSWPIEALKAQSVAARSFALTGRVSGNGFDLYDDTRSQVYGGIAAEAASTNRAIAQTNGQVVMSAGKVATCYFSSTSGGHTENLEFSFVGSKPVSYLKGVPDPYDNTSPYHRWKLNVSQGRMQSALSRYLKGGKLRAIKVNRRGASPRIVYATVISSRGKTRVTGSTLKTALGLRDTWAFFKKFKKR
jgi:stage II sporulation protein D